MTLIAVRGIKELELDHVPIVTIEKASRELKEQIMESWLAISRTKYLLVDARNRHDTNTAETHVGVPVEHVIILVLVSHLPVSYTHLTLPTKA